MNKMLYSDTSQSTLELTILYRCTFLHLNMEMAAISNARFLKKVSQFERTSASPKHPQSDIGLSMASQSVSGVKKDITMSITVGMILRWIPKNRYNPSANSIIPISIAPI